MPPRLVPRQPVRNASFSGALEKIRYAFRGSRDGAYPYTALVVGENGALYGTTSLCGTKSCQQPSFTGGRGVVFRMTPTGRYEVLLRFDSERGRDGYGPSGLIRNANGALYGTAFGGATSPSCPIGCGTVFKLTRVELRFVDSVVYRFKGGDDGDSPAGGVIADKTGALYGTTDLGGNAPACNQSGTIYGCGTVFKLTRTGSSYKESMVYRFQGGSDGARPFAGLTLDGTGALYGTTTAGGGSNAICPGQISGCGTVFKLTPSPSGYVESVLHRFQGGTDGSMPQAGLIADKAGALYGTTSSGGGACPPGCGTVFKLTPARSGYALSILYRFQGGVDGDGPSAGLLADGTGAFYGTTVSGGGCGGACGTVFKLTPAGSGYAESIVYAFQGSPDGSHPSAALIANAGALYGTTTEGGDLSACAGCGTVFRLTP